MTLAALVFWQVFETSNGSHYSVLRSIQVLCRHFGLVYCKNISSSPFVFTFYDLQNDVTHNRGSFKDLALPQLCKTLLYITLTTYVRLTNSAPPPTVPFKKVVQNNMYLIIAAIQILTFLVNKY